MSVPPAAGAGVPLLLLHAVATSAAMANSEARRFMFSPFPDSTPLTGKAWHLIGQPGQILDFAMKSLATAYARCLTLSAAIC